jgi:hypothetical protein
VGGAVLVLCAGGIAIAAAVGSAPTPDDTVLGPAVVVDATSTTNGSGPPASPSTPRPRTSTGGEHDNDRKDSDEPQVVGPAPVHEVDDDEAREHTSASHG